MERYQNHFRSKTRSFFAGAASYLKGLMQAEDKNMERMGEVVAGCNDQQLQHMLTHAKWDHDAVMKQVSQDADHLLGDDQDGCLIIDESSFIKKGKHSVGVARQWCGRLGKVDNCQVGVFAALGAGKHASLVDAKLYLPREWTDDKERCKKAGIPDDIVFKTKCSLAEEMVKESKKRGLRFGWVGLDGGYHRQRSHPWGNKNQWIYSKGNAPCSNPFHPCLMMSEASGRWWHQAVFRVTFQTNRYSVPAKYASSRLILKA